MSDEPDPVRGYHSKRRRHSGGSIAAIFASVLTTAPAFAQAPAPAVHFDNDLTEAEMISRLAGTSATVPSGQQQEQLKFRRIVISPGQSTSSKEGSSIPTQAPHSLQLRVNFAFDSAQIGGDAREVLAKVKDALDSKELIGDRFIVAGHTDAVGSDAYNEKLSERRSEAVRDFLTRAGVTGSRLYVVGFGRSRLADPAHPTAAVNRRVEIIKVGG